MCGGGCEREHETNERTKKGTLANFFNSGNLAKKISAATGALVIGCMAAMVLVSTLLSRHYLQTSINAEFAGIADKNGVVVQKILDEAVIAATDLQDYVEEMYVTIETDGYSGAVEKSVLYDVELQEISQNLEDYILHTAWSTIGNSDYLEGMGAFFEPNAFDAAVEDYTIYVGQSNAANKTCQSYGVYENYCSIDAYIGAINQKQAVLSQLAGSNFDIQTQVNYPGEFDSIQASVYALVKDLSKTLSKIYAVSESVSLNADNISQGAQSLTDGASEQAAQAERLKELLAVFKLYRA